MERWRCKSAAVTGAASGIGAAIAERLLTAGINVVGLDLQLERLERRAEANRQRRNGQPDLGSLHAVKCDLASEEDIVQAFRWIDRNLGPLHILVNCAGVIDYHPIIDADRQSFDKLINVNVIGMASCIGKAVQSMKKHNVEGHIFNINSVLGHEIPERVFAEKEGSNGYNLYPASKHATVAMTHSIRREISRASLPIRITSISPGLVRTEIAQHNEEVKSIFDKFPCLDPTDIADAIIFALSLGQKVQITELTVRSLGEF